MGEGAFEIDTENHTCQKMELNGNALQSRINYSFIFVSKKIGEYF